MEMYRRIALVVGFVLGVLLFFWADFGPFLLVEPVDFATEQSEEGRSFPITSERTRYLRQLPLDEYIEDITRDKVLTEKGEEWKTFTSRIVDAAAGNPDDESWDRRRSGDDLKRLDPPRRYFFRESERPLQEVGEDLRALGGEIYVAVPEGEETRYIRIKAMTIGPGDFQLGSGLMVHPEPPAGFLHPLRRTGIAIFGLGLALYFFLPGRRRIPGEIRYSGGRIILGDLVGFMLFSLFFLMPFLIVGGATQALPPGFFMPLIFWPLALLGLVIIIISMRHANLKILLSENRLAILSDAGDFDIPFDAIHSWGRAVLAPPKWLIVLTWLSALASRGGARYGAMGRASILSGASYGGLALKLKDGRSIFLWITDQLGHITMKGAERIPDALRKSAVPEAEKPVEIRSIGAPITDDPASKRRSRRAVLGLVAAMVLPFMALVFIFSVTGIGSRYTATSPSRAEKSAMESRLLGSLVGITTWEHVYRDCELCPTGFGRNIVHLPDGGYLLVGSTLHSGNNVDILLLRVSAAGDLMWSKAVGTPLWDYAEAVTVLKDGNILLAGVTRPYSILIRLPQAYIMKIDPEGTVLWERIYGREDRSESILVATEDRNGTLRFLGTSDDGVFLLTTDAEGESGDLRLLPGIPVDPGRTIRTAVFLPDGGAILAGETEQPGAGFVNALLVRLDARGNHLWTRTYGTTKKDAFYSVLPLKDGGFAAAGLTESTGGHDGCLYVVRTDGLGEPIWTLAHRPAHFVRGIDLIVGSDGRLVVLGERPTDGKRLPSLRLTVVSDEGALIRDESFSDLNRTYYPAMIASRNDAILITGQVVEIDFGTGRAFFTEVKIDRP